MSKASDELSRLIGSRGLLVCDTALWSGVDEDDLIEYLNHEKKITLDDAKKLAKYFGVPINSLYPYEDQEPIDNPFESTAIIVSPCGVGGDTSEEEVDQWEIDQAIAEMSRLNGMGQYDEWETIE